MRSYAITLLLIAPLAACSSAADPSGGDGGLPDAGAADVVDGATTSDAGTFGQEMPQVVDAGLGPVIAQPRVTAITYDNDSSRSDIEAFYGNFAASTAWAAQTAEYGTGALVAGAPQHITGNAPASATDTDLHGILTQNLTGSAPAWGAPDPNGVYAFFFPKGTAFDDGSGLTVCQDYDGYHSDVVVGGVDVAYTVSIACPGFDQGLTDLQQITVSAAHELVEAVTDPLRDEQKAAWGYPDDAHFVWWYTTGGGEVADMCAGADTSYWIPSDMKYMVQRAWSNAAATAGHDPCVGQPTEPYYQTIPLQNDTINLSALGVTTKGTKIAKGAQGTVTLHVYADQAAGPFTVTVQDYSAYLGGTPYLQISVPSGQVNPGDEIVATVKVLGQDPGLANGEAYVVTTRPSTGPRTYYFGLIGQ